MLFEAKLFDILILLISTPVAKLMASTKFDITADAVASPPAPLPYNMEVPNLSPLTIKAFITPPTLENIFSFSIKTG